jgi:hypothetical protein
MREMRDLADHFDYAWLTAASRALMGLLAALQGRHDEAQQQLDDALEVSLAIRMTRMVTVCVSAFAQLAFARRDPERAALLAGAAQGLRERAGITTWPVLRRGEAELVSNIRQSMAAEQFDRAFNAGSRLSQQEVVAAIWDDPGDDIPSAVAETADPGR